MLDLKRIRKALETKEDCRYQTEELDDELLRGTRTLLEQVEKDIYAMARALLYLRQTHHHDEWYNEEYVAAGPINLLINALGTKDIRAILEKHDES
jgi:hypothetical protein